MRKMQILYLFTSIIYCISQTVTGEVKQVAKKKNNLKEIDLKVISKSKKLKYKIEKEEKVRGIFIYKIKVFQEERLSPEQLRVHWRIPSSDIVGQWTSNSYRLKFLYPEWSGNAAIKSRAARHAPVTSLYSSNDRNKITFACSDALNTVTLKAGIKEEDAFFDCEVILFDEKMPALTEYEFEVLIDLRDTHFSESLNNVSKWWAEKKIYKPMYVPEYARLPMYSTWYSFHQNLVVKDVLEQCRFAKELGYEAVIVDDGWQTTDNNRGYAFTGDWKPERIPEMKDFIAEVHKIGMKFILWYSVPYIGEKSNNHNRFKGKYLNYWGGRWGGSYTLDPRYPEVREFLINTYEKAMTEWNVDGFKLDFIDSFIAKKDTEFSKKNGRDYASVNRAVDRLMTDVTHRLRRINPDVLIEFRQSYIGPLMRKYGNMFRAGDSPDSYHFNRVRTTDLRLLSGSTAVHADMMMWHPGENKESAALQLINVLFSVPQLSVKIDKIPKEHKKVIRFWNSYWLKNRTTLLDGKFTASNPAHNYTRLSAESEKKRIMAMFANELVTLDQTVKKTDIINGKLLSGIAVNLPKTYMDLNYVIKDCTGAVYKTGKIKKGIYLFDVPASGILEINE